MFSSGRPGLFSGRIPTSAIRGLATLVAALVLSLLPAVSIRAQDSWFPGEDSPRNSIRFQHDLGILATETEPFWISIHVRHTPNVDAVHIGLDYDELLMRFSESWNFQDAVGREPCKVFHDVKEGYLELYIPLETSGFEVSEETLLIQLQFILQPGLDSTQHYGYRTNADLIVDDANTWFINGESQAHVASDVSFDGNVSIYYRDAIEIGSAKISPNRQVFSLPVYVTHLKEEANPFSMGLDYDEVLLDLVNVDPFGDDGGDRIDEGRIQFESKEGPAGKAEILLPFSNGIYPRMFRQHLFDLVFEYRQDSDLPPSRPLEVIPLPGQDRIEGGASVLDVRDGILEFIEPKFIRGDANMSGRLDLADALSILSFLTGCADEKLNPSNCLDAMDADGSRGINLTDAIFLLNYLYMGGERLPAPFPEAESLGPYDPGLGCPGGAPAFVLLPIGPSR